MGFTMEQGVLKRFTPEPWEKKVIVPGNCTEIADFAFQSIDTLERVVIPGGCRRIGEGAFRDCRALSEVKMENGIKIIGKEAFLGCASLCTVELPDTLERVEENAFGEIPWYQALRSQRRHKGKLLRKKNDFVRFGTSYYEYVGHDGVVAKECFSLGRVGSLPGEEKGLLRGDHFARDPFLVQGIAKGNVSVHELPGQR